MRRCRFSRRSAASAVFLDDAALCYTWHMYMAIWQYAASSTVSAPSQGCRSESERIFCCIVVYLPWGNTAAFVLKQRPIMPDGHLRNDVHRKHAAAQIRRRVSTPHGVLFVSPSNVLGASAASHSDAAGLPSLGRNP